MPALKGSSSVNAQTGSARLLLHLRDATRPEHLHVERHPLLAPLMSRTLSRGRYALILRAFCSYFTHLDAALPGEVARLQPGPDAAYQYLLRTERLAHDLEDLEPDVAPDEGADGALPRVSLATPDHLLGTLYVLEGATQGGRLIAPMLQRTLGVDAAFGARYFHLHGHGQWGRFRAMVTGREAAHDARRAEAGAREAFNVLSAHLDLFHGARDRSEPHGSV